MTSKIVVNNIEPDSGISTVTVIGDCQATTFKGDGSNLTNLPAQATISNNADNRVITGGSGVNLNGESGLTFSSNTLTINTNGSSFAENNVRFQPPGKAYIDHATTGQDIDIRTSVSSSLDTTGITIKSNGNLAFASGKGIDFSATANSSGTMENELLNDYEEGTWVPVYQNVSTPNYGHRSGRYTKIGRFVYLVCQISVDSGLDTSDGSTVNIGGFPFTGNNAHGSCLFTLGQYIDVMPDSTIDLFTNVRFNGNAVMLHEGRNNQDITYTQLNSSGNLQFACSYAL